MQFDRLNRREFITLLGGAATWPLAARAQQGDRVWRVGVLMPFYENDPEIKLRYSAFTQALGDLGWIEGRSVRMDLRWAGDTAIGRGRSRRSWSACNPTSSWQARPRRPPPSSGKRGRSRLSLWA